MMSHLSSISPRWRRRWIVLALLWFTFGCLIYNAAAQSPTMDEQNHLARGAALLHTGDPRLSIEHPPLINVWAALPLSLLPEGVHLPLEDWSWEQAEWYRFAGLFMWEANADADLMVFLARFPIIALTVWLAALVGRWARELWGAPAGVLAMALVVFSPNLLAHGSLVTTDLGVTFTVTLAAYAVWRLAREFSWPGLALAGLAMGAMLASKTSAPLFWGVLGLLYATAALREAGANSRWRAFLAHVGHYALLTGIALVVLWASYAFEMAPVVEGGPSLPLGTYGRGLLAVLQNVQGERTAYLLGETRLGGWPLYFPITYAVKTPLAVFFLLGWAAFLAARHRRGRRTLFLGLPVAGYWLIVLRSDLNLGFRHLLPTLPLLDVWMAQIAAELSRARWPSRRALIARGLLALLLAWLVVDVVGIAPHFLAYFNPVGGGPERGWRIVADSNIDWGQDLKYLRDYLAEQGRLGAQAEGADEIKLSWFGTARPEVYGIAYEPLPGLPYHYDLWFAELPFDPAQPEPGTYIISVSNLVELPLVDKRFFAWFRAREPDVRIGYSIYIYYVEDGESP